MFGLTSFSQTSFATVNKQVAVVCTVASTSATSLVKKALITLITLGNKYLIIGGLNGKPLNELAVNNDAPVYTTTTGVSNTSTLSTNNVFSKVLAVTQTVVATIVIKFKYLKTVVANAAISTATIVKQANKTVASVVSSVVTFIKAIKTSVVTNVSSSVVVSKLVAKTVALTQATTIFLNAQKVRLVALVVAVANTTSLKKIAKLQLAVVSLSISVMITQLTKYVLLVASATSHVLLYIYKIVGDVRDLVYVPTRKVVVQKAAGFTTLLVRPSKTTVIASEQDNVNG